MSAGLRPMLAHSEPVSPNQIAVSPAQPVWMSPKLDGVRCLAVQDQALSRKLKPFPNRFVQRYFRQYSDLLHGLDGELVVGNPTHPLCITNTTSGVMSRDGAPAFAFYVFDHWHVPDRPFRERYRSIKRRVQVLQRAGFPAVLVEQRLCSSAAEIEEALAGYYESGYEGAICRSYDSPYKYNRSTLRESYMLKLKDSVDFEIEVRQFIEMRHNQNEAATDALGLTKRSTHKANKVGAGTLGRMEGPRLDTGEWVTVGTGKMTAEEKLHVWQNQEQYRGRISKCRAAAHGTKDLPRHPRHITWRDPIDL